MRKISAGRKLRKHLSPSEWDKILPKTSDFLYDHNDIIREFPLHDNPSKSWLLDEIQYIYENPDEFEREINDDRKLKQQISELLVNQFLLDDGAYDYDEEIKYVKSGRYAKDKKKAREERIALEAKNKRISQKQKKDQEKKEHEIEKLYNSSKAGHADDFAKLISHLESKNQDEQTLKKLVISKLGDLNNETAFAALENFFRLENDLNMQNLIAISLGKIDSEKGLKLMHRLLKSAKTRKSAALGIEILGTKKDTESLCNYLNTKDDRTLITIINTLKTLGDKQAVAPLEERLKSCFKYKKQFFWCKVAEGDVNIRFSIVDALKTIDDPSCISTLAEVLEYEMDALKHWAGTYNGQMIDEILGAIMHFAGRLESKKIDDVVYPVIKILNETEVNVRMRWDERIMYAANTLGKLGSKNALPHLERRLKEFEEGDFENPDYQVFTIQAKATPSEELPEWLLDAVRTAIKSINHLTHS